MFNILPPTESANGNWTIPVGLLYIGEVGTGNYANDVIISKSILATVMLICLQYNKTAVIDLYSNYMALQYEPDFDSYFIKKLLCKFRIQISW